MNLTEEAKLYQCSECKAVYLTEEDAARCEKSHKVGTATTGLGDV